MLCEIYFTSAFARMGEAGKVSLPVSAPMGKISLAWDYDLALERKQFQQPDLLPFFGRAQELLCTDRMLQRRERMDNFLKFISLTTVTAAGLL